MNETLLTAICVSTLIAAGASAQPPLDRGAPGRPGDGSVDRPATPDRPAVVRRPPPPDQDRGDYNDGPEACEPCNVQGTTSLPMKGESQ